MREYQDDNTRLYFLVTPSFNLQGPWEQNDIETIQREYAEGLLRDGNGILQWFMSMHDIKQPEKQMALRADLQKTKFTTEMSCLQMLKANLRTTGFQWPAVPANVVAPAPEIASMSLSIVAPTAVPCRRGDAANFSGASTTYYIFRDATRPPTSAGRPCRTTTERQGVVDGALGPANDARDGPAAQTPDGVAARDGQEGRHNTPLEMNVCNLLPG